MHSRRIACLLLGVWMGAGAWMLWVTRANAAAADTLLLNPGDAATAYLKTVGRASWTPMAHYLAAEQNRALFEIWGVVQIALAAVFFFFLLFGTRLGKAPLAVGLLLLAIAIGERAAIAPALVMVGRAVDFNVDPSHRVRIAQQALDYGYFMAETSKFVLGAIAAAFLVWQPSRRSLHSRNEIDLIDKANYRHIDG